MNGGKETGASLGRNKTAQFSLTECLSDSLTQWKRSQSITAEYLWNKMYNSVGTWHTACVPHKGLPSFDLTGAVNRTADGRPETQLNMGGRGQTVAELQGKHHKKEGMHALMGGGGPEPKGTGERCLDGMLLGRPPCYSAALSLTNRVKSDRGHI